MTQRDESDMATTAAQEQSDVAALHGISAAGRAFSASIRAATGPPGLGYYPPAPPIGSIDHARGEYLADAITLAEFEERVAQILETSEY